MKEQDNASKSLAHTKWNCKYHMILNLGEIKILKIMQTASS